MRLRINYLFISLLVLSLSACSNKELTRDKAREILQQSMEKTPSRDTASTNVMLDNPYVVAQYKSLLLEKEGYWKLNADSKVKQNVLFTEKAKPYLIGGVTKQREGDFFRGYSSSSHQKVMTAKIEVGEVTGIELEPGDRKAIVEFTLKLSPTPFAQLDRSIEQMQSKSLKAPMVLYDDGWRIDESSPFGRLFK